MPVKSYFQGFFKYSPLLWEFVKRDIKTRYRRSFLGLLWTLLNPLFTMIILTVVFSTLFKSSIINFPVYLMAGQTLFGFFQESSTNAMHSIIGGSSLIKKVYIPKYLFPLSKICSGLVNLVASLISLFIVMLATDVALRPALLLVIFPVIFVFLFTFGMGLVLSSVAMFFRDTIHFYTVLTTAWVYLTPMFYPLEILPRAVRIVVELNPLTSMIEYLRLIALHGVVPPLELNLICFMPGFIFLIVGLLFFYRTQDRFILHM